MSFLAGYTLPAIFRLRAESASSSRHTATVRRRHVSDTADTADKYQRTLACAVVSDGSSETGPEPQCSRIGTRWRRVETQAGQSYEGTLSRAGFGAR